MDNGWEGRLSAKQTGPIRLGFCTNASAFEKEVPAINPLTDGPTTQTIIAEGRITRIPLVAIITVLLALPAWRCISAIRRRRAGPRAERRSLVYLGREWAFKVAVTISALLLIFTLFEWKRAQSVDLNIAWSSSWKSPGWEAWDDNSLTRDLDFTRDGWQVSRIYYVAGEPRVALNSTSNLSIRQAPFNQTFLLITQSNLAHFLSFGFGHEDGRSGDSRQLGWTAVIPHWGMAIVFGMLPGIWVLKMRVIWRRRRRIRIGLCVNCGYDLRASSDVCPECGVATGKKRVLVTGAK